MYALPRYLPTWGRTRRRRTSGAARLIIMCLLRRSRPRTVAWDMGVAAFCLCVCLVFFAAAVAQAEVTAGAGGELNGAAGSRIQRLLQQERGPVQNLDAAALLQFKKNVSLDPTGALSNWGQTANPCFWTGVSCDAFSSHVLKLNLTGRGLQGVLDPAICGVPLLNSIDLSHNNFSGNIPDLQSCFSLLELRLNDNGFTGLIPSTLGLLRSLQVLVVSNNQLVGSIPEELGLLGAQLVALNLDGNSLNGTIPGSLTNLSRLTDFRLSRNSLAGGMPLDLGSLGSLQYLNMSSNLLSGTIPPSLTNCSMLRVLDLSSNQLSGGIPADLRRLTFLQVLHLETNNLSGRLPISLSNCTILMEVVASGNGLAGIIPPDIGRLAQLQTLDLSDNRLTGGIPASLLGCLQLSSLNLSFNPLGGVLLPDIGTSLTQLTSISVAGCNLTGDFPVSLSGCTLLQVLHVSHNPSLGGQLPQSFAQSLPNLRVVDLGFNRLNGSIPSSFGMSLNLLLLDLQGNRLTGSIPPELGNATSLQYLELADNLLEGALPAQLAKLTSLRVLDLQLNRLNGFVPDLSNCKQLSILGLAGNQFSGGIPVSFGNLSSLQNLDLSKNTLTGPIPPQIGSLNLVTSIDLSSNQLVGGIPASLKGCTALVSLNLSDNPSLGGSVPSALGDLHRLQFLALSNCSLSREIPKELGSPSSQLQSIDLSHNNLTGPIPASLGNLPLTYVDFSFNSLEGPIPQQWEKNPRISSASFFQNPALCGAILSRPCTTFPGQESDSTASSKDGQAGFLVGIGVAGFLVVVVFTLLFWRYCWRQHRFCENGANFQRLGFRSPFKQVSPFKYTEEELISATAGFSDDNLLGSGALGTVHKGVLTSGRLVAVRRFKYETNAKETERLFREESEKLGRLRHENLGRVLGSFSSSSKQRWKYLVLEYFEKGSLEMQIHPTEAPNDGCPLDWSLRIDILIGIAQGLAFLHHAQSPQAEQIVHGNLKPSNIMLDEEMQPQLMDFGMTMLIQVSNVTNASRKGSTGYTAPECLDSPTPAGDVYSFGVVVLEMLTQQKPTDNSAERKGESLPTLVRASYPHQMLEILDPHLLANLDTIAATREGARKAVSLVAQVGLLCAQDDVSARPNMHNVVGMLQHIRVGVDKFFGSFRTARPKEIYDALSRTGSGSSIVSSADEDKSAEQGTQ